MQILFLVFVAIIALLVALTIEFYLTGKARTATLTGLTLWLAYAGTLGYFGIIGGGISGGPPGPAFVIVPFMLFAILFLARSNAAVKIAFAIPLGLLLAAQVFRVGVEIFLHQLANEGVVPTMLTFEGANFDILIGLSAPIVAWAYVRGHLSARGALIWNALGIAMLANIAVRAALTMPGPMHLLATDVPNLAIGTFPYTFIPGLMAPLALTLHILAIRVLRSHVRANSPANDQNR